MSGMENSDREHSYGIDLARIVAILLVVMQHVLFQGGIGQEGDSFHRLQLRGLEALSQCCVDLFALISGYMGWRTSGWHLTRFAKLWFHVWTTGLLVLAGVTLFSPVSVSCADWAQAALPLWKDEYWYFTAYSVVFLLAPILTHLPKRRLIVWTLLVAVFLITFLPGGVNWLPFKKGYSATWLAVLFLLGVELRSWEPRLSKKAWPFFLLAVFAVGLTVGQRLVLSTFPVLRELFNDEWTLLCYTSPTVVLTAASLLLAFARLDLRGPRTRRAVAALASCSFGVYLLHVQPVFFKAFVYNGFKFLDSVPTAALGLAVVAASLAVFLVLSGVDFLRQSVVKYIRVKVSKRP